MEASRPSPLDPEEILEDLQRGRAVEDDEILAILADVSDAVAHAHADADASLLSSHVNRALEEAWGAAARARVPAPVVGGRRPLPRPERHSNHPAPRRGRAVSPRRPVLAVAAVLVVGLGVGLFLERRTPTASAGLDLRAVIRRGGAAPGTTFGGRLRAGDRVQVVGDEEALFRFGTGNAIALSGGGRLDVLRVSPSLAGDARIVLDLGHGVLDVQVVASPLGVRLPGVEARLDVLEGRMRVETDGRFARLRLGDGARVEVAGPGKHRVLSAGPGPLRAFGARGAAKSGTSALASVSPRRWRVAEGRGRRQGGNLVLEPDAHGRASVAYEPSGLSTGSRGLAVKVVCPARVQVEARAGGRQLAPPLTVEAATRTVVLTLENEWATRLDDGALRLVWKWPEGRSDALVFEGTTFLEHLDPPGSRK